MVAARSESPRRPRVQEAAPDLPAQLARRDRPTDDDLRRLLLALRRGYLLQVRAIDEYLGLPPARSERRGG